MKLPVPCVICSKGRKGSELAFIPGELDDSGVVFLECPLGHRTAWIFNARRYEVLLRSGGKALLSGFANESIATLAAALERAYEFYVRVVCRQHAIPEERIASVWKEVRSSSERQLGAFSFLYLLENGEPLTLNQRLPEIRNRIVHQGRMANDSDAKEFGRLVFQRIRDIERALDRYPESAEAEMKCEVESQEKALPAGMEHGTLRVWSMTAKDGQVIGPVGTFDDFLEALQQAIQKGLA